jgi:hypothetical protein
MLSNNNSNYSPFYSAPREIIHYVSSFLDKQSLSQFCQTSYRLYTLFKPFPTPNLLLRHVMDAEPLETENFLKEQQPRSDENCIVLKRATELERCNRKWQAVSPLEFAAWAGDTEIVQMLLRAVPKTAQRSALKQLEDLLEKGTEHGKHLAAYDSLIAVYEVFIEYNIARINIEHRNRYWRQGIGRKQLLLPIVGLQQICDKEPFAPLPSFYRPPERSCILSNGSSLMPLFRSGLGSSFALFKGRREEGMREGAVPIAGVSIECNDDIAALRHLCKVRTQELEEIIKQLKKSIDMESHQYCCLIS